MARRGVDSARKVNTHMTGVLSLWKIGVVRRLVADGVPKSRIDTQLGIFRTTVCSAAQSIEPPRCERSTRQTTFSPYELTVRSLLRESPRMPATVTADQLPSVAAEREDGRGSSQQKLFTFARAFLFNFRPALTAGSTAHPYYLRLSIVVLRSWWRGE